MSLEAAVAAVVGVAETDQIVANSGAADVDVVTGAIEAIEAIEVIEVTEVTEATEANIAVAVVVVAAAMALQFLSTTKLLSPALEESRYGHAHPFDSAARAHRPTVYHLRNNQPTLY